MVSARPPPPPPHHQPLFSHDRTRSCAVNGEIYNHKELMMELKDKTPFRTASDCEVRARRHLNLLLSRVLDLNVRTFTLHLILLLPKVLLLNFLTFTHISTVFR